MKMAAFPPPAPPNGVFTSRIRSGFLKAHRVGLHPEGSVQLFVLWNAVGMALLADHESLSRGERLRRIGALVAKAVALASPPVWGQEPGSDTGLVPVSPREGDFTQEAEALLQRFVRLGEFAPHDAAIFWGVSRSTAYRRLRRLEQAGCIKRQGETNAVRYHLIFEKLPLAAQVNQIVQVPGGAEARPEPGDL
jgi:hypothetical protein